MEPILVFGCFPGEGVGWVGVGQSRAERTEDSSLDGRCPQFSVGFNLHRTPKPKPHNMLMALIELWADYDVTHLGLRLRWCKQSHQEGNPWWSWEPLVPAFSHSVLDVDAGGFKGRPTSDSCGSSSEPFHFVLSGFSVPERTEHGWCWCHHFWKRTGLFSPVKVAFFVWLVSGLRRKSFALLATLVNSADLSFSHSRGYLYFLKDQDSMKFIYICSTSK